jgi:hypothetical protein
MEVPETSQLRYISVVADREVIALADAHFGTPQGALTSRSVIFNLKEPEETCVRPMSTLQEGRKDTCGFRRGYCETRHPFRISRTRKPCHQFATVSRSRNIPDMQSCILILKGEPRACHERPDIFDVSYLAKPANANSSRGRPVILYHICHILVLFGDWTEAREEHIVA